MDKIESDILKSQEITPFLWYRYTEDVFFIWTHDEEKLESFIDDLNSYHLSTKFTHESNKGYIPFFDLNVNLYIESTDRHQ